MIEALWSVDFHSGPQRVGSGVVAFETGRVFGGDAIMIYVGRYEVEQGVVHVTCRVSRYAHAPDFQPIFGSDQFALVLAGQLQRHEMRLAGHVVDRPDLAIEFHAIRRAELP